MLPGRRDRRILRGAVLEEESSNSRVRAEDPEARAARGGLVKLSCVSARNLRRDGDARPLPMQGAADRTDVGVGRAARPRTSNHDAQPGRCGALTTTTGDAGPARAPTQAPTPPGRALPGRQNFAGVVGGPGPSAGRQRTRTLWRQHWQLAGEAAGAQTLSGDGCSRLCSLVGALGPRAMFACAGACCKTSGLYIEIRTLVDVSGSNHRESTWSHQNPEVKLGWAGSVRRWGTTLEPPVSACRHIFCRSSLGCDPFSPRAQCKS